MTRDEAIDRILSAMGMRALYVRLLASQEPSITQVGASDAIALAGKIVDALPLVLAEDLSPAQRDWLAAHDEFEPVAKPCADVAHADLVLLRGDGKIGWHWSGRSAPGMLLVGIPCIPEKVPA